MTEGEMAALIGKIKEALTGFIDLEMGYDIVGIGLVYEIAVHGEGSSSKSR